MQADLLDVLTRLASASNIRCMRVTPPFDPHPVIVALYSVIAFLTNVTACPAAGFFAALGGGPRADSAAGKGNRKSGLCAGCQLRGAAAVLHIRRAELSGESGGRATVFLRRRETACLCEPMRIRDKFPEMHAFFQKAMEVTYPEH